MEKKKINGANYVRLLSGREIEHRVREIALNIKENFADAGKPPILLIVLKGGLYFGVDLSRALSLIDCEHEIDTIGLESYRGDENGGPVKVTSLPQSSLAGRDVIIIEDVLDSGDTLRFLGNYFRKPPKNKQIRSLSYCVLLKKQHYNPNLRLSYFGFSVPNDWVVGNGMDSEGLYRGLPDIYLKMHNNDRKSRPKKKNNIPRRRRDRGDSL